MGLICHNNKCPWGTGMHCRKKFPALNENGLCSYIFNEDGTPKIKSEEQIKLAKEFLQKQKEEEEALNNVAISNESEVRLENTGD